MSTYTPEQLKEILNLHGKWLRNEPDGQRANLRHADLTNANLAYANLAYADLTNAKLTNANLANASLYGANLAYADLTGVKLPAFSHCPEVGAFTAFKKLAGGVVATLLIPAEAKRTSSLVGRKCRAEFVQVVELSHGVSSARSTHDNGVTYCVGEVVHPDKYDDDIRVECTHGIHFFVTRKEAEDY